MFQRELSNEERSHFLVMRNGDEIAGYIGFWMARDEAHIITLAVRSDFRRKGVGSVLMASALTLALSIGATASTLEVRTSNLPAQELYKKFGFKTVALRRKFYSDTGEDAYVMWLRDLEDKMKDIRADILKKLHGKTEETG